MVSQTWTDRETQYQAAKTTEYLTQLFFISIRRPYSLVWLTGAREPER